MTTRLIESRTFLKTIRSVMELTLVLPSGFLIDLYVHWGLLFWDNHYYLFGSIHVLCCVQQTLFRFMILALVIPIHP